LAQKIRNITKLSTRRNTNVNSSHVALYSMRALRRLNVVEITEECGIAVPIGDRGLTKRTREKIPCLFIS